MSKAQHNTEQHNTTKLSTAQNNTAQHNTTKLSTAQHNKAQNSTAQHNKAQNNTTKHRTAQHNTAPHNTTKQNTAQGQYRAQQDKPNRSVTDLNELGDLAHLHPEVPEAEEVLGSRGRQTDQHHQQVRHGQVHQEDVGGTAHARVPPDSEADEAVAAQPDDEDDEEEDDEKPAKDDGDEGLVQIVVVVVVVVIVDDVVGEIVGEVEDEGGGVEAHVVVVHRGRGSWVGGRSGSWCKTFRRRGPSGTSQEVRTSVWCPSFLQHRIRYVRTVHLSPGSLKSRFT